MKTTTIKTAKIVLDSMLALLNADGVPPVEGVTDVLPGEGALLVPEALPPEVPLPEPLPLEALLLGPPLVELLLAELLPPVVVPLELLPPGLLPPKDSIVNQLPRLLLVKN